MYEVNSSDPTAVSVYVCVCRAFVRQRLYPTSPLLPPPPPPQIYDYEGVSKNINCMGFNQSGIWMYSGGEDKTARIWDLRWGSAVWCSVRVLWCAV